MANLISIFDYLIHLMCNASKYLTSALMLLLVNAQAWGHFSNRHYRNDLMRFGLTSSAIIGVPRNNPSAFSILADEFHHGSGGFSITPIPGVPEQRQIVDELGNYRLWGESFAWKNSDFHLTISFFNVINGSTLAEPNEKPLILSKWKSRWKLSIIENAGAEKTTFEEARYEFNGFKGLEIRSSGTHYTITRAYFIGSRLFVLSLAAQDPFVKTAFIPSLNSFRLLTKDERTRAMIEQFAPPALDQGRSATKPDSRDVSELGLRGMVSRIRESYKPNSKSENLKVREIHFNEDGFKTREISFNEGYPDVITSWGWIDGKRVNLQSAVNYPDREGPHGSRTIVVSGYQPFSFSRLNGQDIAALARQFGNRIETELDQKNRPVTKRRYSNNGSLVYVEHFLYTDKRREIKITDSVGGFISRTRELLDAQLNVVEIQTVTSDGSIIDSTQFEYEFDANQNWVVKKAYTNHGKRIGRKAMGISFRDIVYHDFS